MGARHYQAAAADPELSPLSDQGLQACTAAAVYLDDRKLMNRCAIELERRGLIPASPLPVHRVPRPLWWLPRLFWKQKPAAISGGGEG